MVLVVGTLQAVTSVPHKGAPRHHLPSEAITDKLQACPASIVSLIWAVYTIAVTIVLSS